MEVPIIGSTMVLGVTIRRYRNAQDLFDKRSNDNDPTNDVNGMPEELDATEGFKTAWTALRAKIIQHGEPAGTNMYRLRFPLVAKGKPAPPAIFDQVVNTSELARVFFGKGMPECCKLALQLAAAFGLVEPTFAALQNYCDKYVGLDCNGFVGNYLNRKGCKVVGPETPAYPAYFVPVKHRVGTLKEITMDSVLVWDIGHVAIVDHITGIFPATPPSKGDVLRCSVCESTGSRAWAPDVSSNGLNFTTYEIHPPKSGQVFHVERTVFTGTQLSPVYIGNLN